MSTTRLSHSASEVVKQLLIDLGLGTLSLDYGDWPIYVNNEPNQPDNCITLTDTSGTTDEKFQFDGQVQDNFGMQVRVRATLFTGGNDKIQAIVAALDASREKNRSPINLLHRTGTAVSTYKFHGADRTSGVFALGADPTNSEREIFTANYLLAITEE